MNIGFFVRHFTERGTEIACYDYAHYNETILGNKSYIICFTPDAQKLHGFPDIRYSYAKFQTRFHIIEIRAIGDMCDVIQQYNLDAFYTITAGWPNDIYQFDNASIWGKCKTIKHCVFDTRIPDSDFPLTISNELNREFNTSLTVIPHIVSLPHTDEDLRQSLGIPREAIVFGRYGGYDEFDLLVAMEAIAEYILVNPNAYFLFMNTRPFYYHDRIIYLEKNLDLLYKTKFINTCDAMIHARCRGETFGLSIGEFSVRNRPIITCKTGVELEHIRILGDCALLYESKEDLLRIFSNILQIKSGRENWRAYGIFTPEYVMGLFKTLVFDKIESTDNSAIIIPNSNILYGK